MPYSESTELCTYRILLKKSMQAHGRCPRGPLVAVPSDPSWMQMEKCCATLLAAALSVFFHVPQQDVATSCEKGHLPYVGVSLLQSSHQCTTVIMRKVFSLSTFAEALQ